jgi:hypothetical protein
VTLRSRMKTVSVLFFLGVVAGCQGSKEDQGRKLNQKRASWEATVQLTDELSGRGALPAEYRRQVLEKAEKNLQKIHTQASQLSQ